MMVLFAIVNVTIFLVFGGLAPRIHVSNDHGWLLTSTGRVCACGSTVPQISVGEHYMDITTRRTRSLLQIGQLLRLRRRRNSTQGTFTASQSGLVFPHSRRSEC